MSARWFVKKAARQGVSLGSWPASLALGRARRALGGGPRARVLTYHRVGDAHRDPFCVSRQAFDAQMRLLAEEGRAISLETLRAFVAGAADIPDDACLVTIDDGCESTLTECLPILRRHGVPAVAYVTSSLVGLSVDELPERYLDWSELAELTEGGLVDIGSHARTHRSLGLMDPGAARDEARRSKEELEDGLGHEITSFAYPFGTRSDFTPVTERGIADAGYKLAFNSMHGAVRRGLDPISLPRVKVEGGEGLGIFRRLSLGAMDGWRVVDQNLWRLQRVRQEIG